MIISESSVKIIKLISTVMNIYIKHFLGVNSGRLSIFNDFMHFSNILFSKESENNHFSRKKLSKKLFNYEVIFSYSTLIKLKLLIFRMFYMLIEYFMLVFMIPVDS